MKNYVEVGKKGSDGHTENTRLLITLSKSDSDVYRSVNYRKMVASENGSGTAEFLEMEDPHDRFNDYEEDSYIDNSELFRDTYPPGQEPENLGFFINFGKLKLKDQRSKSTTDEDRWKKRRKHHQDKERKQSKLEKHSKWPSLDIPSNSHRQTVECEPSFSSAQGIATMTNAEEFVTENPDYLGKIERKKLKLLRKDEKKIRKNHEKVKSTEKKKKIDPNLALDKILMARMKKVKHVERKTINPSSNYMFLPGFQAGPFPFFNIKP